MNLDSEKPPTYKPALNSYVSVQYAVSSPVKIDCPCKMNFRVVWMMLLIFVKQFFLASMGVELIRVSLRTIMDV